jgi:hypothetical protein
LDSTRPGIEEGSFSIAEGSPWVIFVGGSYIASRPGTVRISQGFENKDDRISGVEIA